MSGAGDFEGIEEAIIVGAAPGVEIVDGDAIDAAASCAAEAPVVGIGSAGFNHLQRVRIRSYEREDQLHPRVGKENAGVLLASVKNVIIVVTTDEQEFKARAGVIIKRTIGRVAIAQDESDVTAAVNIAIVHAQGE